MINLSFNNGNWVSTMVLIAWQEPRAREVAQTPLTVEFTWWWSSRGALPDPCGNERLILGSDYESAARVKQSLELGHLEPRMSCCCWWWEPRKHPSRINPWAATKCEDVYWLTSPGPKAAAAAAAELQLMESQLTSVRFPWQGLHSMPPSWVSELQMEYWQKSLMFALKQATRHRRLGKRNKGIPAACTF